MTKDIKYEKLVAFVKEVATPPRTYYSNAAQDLLREIGVKDDSKECKRDGH